MALDGISYTADPGRWAREVAAAIKDLQLRFQPQPVIKIALPYVFDFDGGLAVATSKVLPVPIGGTLQWWVAYLTTSGSDDTVVELLLDGSSVASITLPDSVHFGYVGLVEHVDRGSALRADITTAGTGAADLVCVTMEIADSQIGGQNVL